MPNRSSTGLLLPVVIVVGLVAVFGGSNVVGVVEVEGIFSGNDPVIIGTGDTAVMVVKKAYEGQDVAEDQSSCGS